MLTLPPCLYAPSPTHTKSEARRVQVLSPCNLHLTKVFPLTRLTFHSSVVEELWPHSLTSTHLTSPPTKTQSHPPTITPPSRSSLAPRGPRTWWGMGVSGSTAAPRHSHTWRWGDWGFGGPGGELWEEVGRPDGAARVRCGVCEYARRHTHATHFTASACLLLPPSQR